MTYPVPSDARQTKAFLGLAGYYRKFVRSYVELVAPLQRLTLKDCPFDLSDDCQKVFDSIKQRLLQVPILRYADVNKEFFLYTDSSSYSVGYLIGQTDDEGKEYVCEYGGRSLLKHEKAYRITELELLALVEGVYK